MQFSGARIVLACSFLVHFAWINDSFFIFQTCAYQVFLFVASVQGLTYICYPLLGWLADTRFIRYSVIKISMGAVVLLSLLQAIGIVTVTLINFAGTDLLDKFRFIVLLVVALPLAVCIIIMGMFEANAIQFGMYQMLEANSDQLVTFIHWYYWSIQLSRGLMVLVSVGVDSILRSCWFDIHIRTRADAQLLPSAPILLIASLIQGIMAAVGVFILQHYKRHLNIDHVGHSPFTMLYKIVKYAWQHKCPVNRSAFTYWENDIPSRIDLGKDKYGGPFTNEEVEDTKTFFRIFLLLLSFSGLHLSDNGFSSAMSFFTNTCRLCPSAVTFLSLVYAPNIFSSVSIVVIVPLLHFVILPRFNRFIPNLLHRMGLCLAVILIQEVVQIVIAILGMQEYNYCQQEFYHNVYSSARGCYFKNSPFLMNDSCTPALSNSEVFYGTGDVFFLWLLLPIALRSFTYHFAFMTMIEFVCAQAPLKMKGLLIGLWYATTSLKIYSADKFANDSTQWFISHGIKCGLILFSLLLYCCVAKWYRYRARDEVVPVYFMIEERYEREIEQREEYERQKIEERRAFFCS